MLRTGADATEEARGEKVIEVGGKAGGGDRQSEQAIPGAENDAAPHVGHDEAVGGLKNAAEGVVHGGERCDGDVGHAQLFHHQRINHAEHGGLKMIDEVGAADDGENRRALAGFFFDQRLYHRCTVTPAFTVNGSPGVK